MDLRQWLTANVLSYSREETIDPVPMQAVKCRRRLAIDVSKRYGSYGGEPTVCRCFYECPGGLWQPTGGKAGTVVWKTGDKRGREEPSTRAVIRHWKVWRGARIVWASFLRVGARSGAHIMSAGGEVETIARPPFDREPPEMIRALTWGANGHLVDTTSRNPDRDKWDEWAEMITGARLYIEGQRDANKTVANPGPGFRCTACTQYWCNDLVGEWRSVHGLFYCATCYKRYDMRGK